jgi:hypothetical protein
MLPLESPGWSELADAYGASSDIPGLLADLLALPPDRGGEAEPYFSLWSALCHQGDVYTASYAAVPHIVRAIAGGPERAPWSLFQMVACIEIARAKGRGPEIPPGLQADYFAALAQVPELVARAAAASWDHWHCGAALSALAAAKGFTSLAEAILELDPDTIEDMLKRKFGEDVA